MVVMSEVETEIRRQIKETGLITFARFMELALYWPAGGYYATRGRIGAKGDFYTGPSAHPAFGTLICVQLYQMWRLLGCPKPFWVVEMGSGNGILSWDVLSCASKFPNSFCDSLRYLCLDRYPPSIPERPPEERNPPTGLIAADGIPLRGVVGCLLSNELVDSFPVHRVTVEQGALKEVYVTLQEGRYVEVLDVPSTPLLEARLRGLGITLPEGAWVEVNLAMEPWLRAVSASLERGYVLNIDYGHLAPDLYSPSRTRGTLVTYRHHVQIDDPYSHVGEQDITAQVDFTTLMEVGRSCGLEPLGSTTQGRFFNSLGLQRFIRRLPTIGLGQRDVEANRMGMLDIARPGGMGDFKVMVQGKGVGGEHLWGLEPSEEVEELTQGLPVPLLTLHHIGLMEGRYPHLLENI